MIIVSNIKLDINQQPQTAIEVAIKKLNIQKSDISQINLHKVSVDARKGAVKFVYSVAVVLNSPDKEQIFVGKDKDVAVKKQQQIVFEKGNQELSLPPVICGFGPAGLFCALVLARMGFKPIVLEQGEDIDSRTKTVKQFEEKGLLNTKSNIQFGEGGAGTFSDGKLTTRIGDERCGFVSETLVKHGAPNEILYKAKPHIGTDLLVNVIKNIRQEIISLGGKVLFNTCLLDLIVKDEKIIGVKTDKGEIATNNLVLATGHSAREVFFMLKDKGANIEAKPFSVGVRIEHLQNDTDKGLYHNLAQNPILPKGEYQLSCTPYDRGVYTFCMFPGGKVVAAASENDTLVVNGMSNHARNGDNSNSALVVSVSPQDFDNDFTKAIAFQRKLEKTAFELGGKNYKAPAQTVDNFLKGKAGINQGRVVPSYPLGVTEADFTTLFPQEILQSLKGALPLMGRKLSGFDAKDSMLTGVETRTSSPARILRDQNFESNIKGLYPCGEGAGYAGGIMSAAVYGCLIAQHITSKFNPNY